MRGKVGEGDASEGGEEEALFVGTLFKCLVTSCFTWGVYDDVVAGASAVRFVRKPCLKLCMHDLDVFFRPDAPLICGW